MSWRIGAVPLACLVVTLGCESDDDSAGNEVIGVGMFVQQTDQTDAQREISRAVATIRQINDSGGLTLDGQDFDLEMIPEDHGGTAEGGVAAIERLAEQGVSVALGPPWSSLALGSDASGADGMALAARDAHLVLVSGSATSPTITDLPDDGYMNRTVPPDLLQAEIGAAYLLDEGGASTAAILHRDEPWGSGLATAFAEAFTDAGGTITAEVAYDVTGEEIADLDSYSYADELDTVFRDQPDVIYLVSFDEVFQITNRIVVAGHLDAYGATPPIFFGTDGTFSSDLLGNAPPEVLANMSGTSPLPQLESENYQKFAAAMVEAGVGEPENYDSYQYDALYVLAYAIQKAGTAAGEQVKSEIVDVTRDDGDLVVGVDDWATGKAELLAGRDINYDGASGPIELTTDGDPAVSSYVIWKVVETSSDTFEFDTSDLRLFDSR